MKKYLILLIVAILLLAGCTYESYDNNYYGSDDSGSQKEEPQESYILVILSEEFTKSFHWKMYTDVNGLVLYVPGDELNGAAKPAGVPIIRLSSDDLKKLGMSDDEYDYYQEWYYWNYGINGASADKQIVFILIPAADAKRGAANGGFNGGSDVQIPGEIAGGTHVYMISASELQKIVEQGGEVFIVPMSGGTSAEPSVNEIQPGDISSEDILKNSGLGGGYHPWQK